MRQFRGISVLNPEKMINENVERSDEAIRSAISQKLADDPEYWSFRGRAQRNAAHALIQYPAMMVPQMQADLIDIILDAVPTLSTIFDPFVGSGTVLTEAMQRGKNFIGFDINPLAVLACKTKRGPFYIDALEEKIKELVARIYADRKCSIDVSFEGRDKWFRKEAARSLSRIRRAIIAEKSKWARRFFWLAMAECVRLCSNSRTSTYKLHVKSSADMEAPHVNVIALFESVVAANLISYREQAARVSASLSRGAYTGEIRVKRVDSASSSAKRAIISEADFMITSPPYGDNTTTVPYGQFSFLALQWIILDDIDLLLTTDWLKTTHEIDFRSLGGSVRAASKKAENMVDVSPVFKETYTALQSKESTVPHAKRLASFCYDLDRSIAVSASRIRSGGYLVWTLGNRSTGGLTVPLAGIVCDSMKNAGCEFVTAITRRIPSKRMPGKNSISNTMSSETTLIMRRL